VDVIEECARKYEAIFTSRVGWLTENLHLHASRECEMEPWRTSSRSSSTDSLTEKNIEIYDYKVA